MHRFRIVSFWTIGIVGLLLVLVLFWKGAMTLSRQSRSSPVSPTPALVKRDKVVPQTRPTPEPKPIPRLLPVRRRKSLLSSRKAKKKKPLSVRDCYKALAKTGIRFRKRRNPRRRNKHAKQQVCSVVGAVHVYPPIHGVDWVDGDNKSVPMFMRCELALVLSFASHFFKWKQIKKVMHFGTYHCKSLQNDKGRTKKLSQHGLGRAIDIAAFWDASGAVYSFYKHWDHQTRWKKASITDGCGSSSFKHEKARFLYQIVCEMWQYRLFSVMLTPNFNKRHDDHLHLDLGDTWQFKHASISEVDGRFRHPSE